MVKLLQQKNIELKPRQNYAKKYQTYHYTSSRKTHDITWPLGDKFTPPSCRNSQKRKKKNDPEATHWSAVKTLPQQKKNNHSYRGNPLLSDPNMINYPQSFFRCGPPPPDRHFDEAEAKAAVTRFVVSFVVGTTVGIEEIKAISIWWYLDVPGS